MRTRTVLTCILVLGALTCAAAPSRGDPYDAAGPILVASTPAAVVDQPDGGAVLVPTVNGSPVDTQPPKVIATPDTAPIPWMKSIKDALGSGKWLLAAALVLMGFLSLVQVWFSGWFDPPDPKKRDERRAHLAFWMTALPALIVQLGAGVDTMKAVGIAAAAGAAVMGGYGGILKRMVLPLWQRVMGFVRTP